jgi:hypothetical protein
MKNPIPPSSRLQLIFRLTGRADATALFEIMLPRLNNPAETPYCRGIGSIVIPFICRVYPMDGFSHTDCMNLSQGGIDLLTSVKPACPADHYMKHLAPLERAATRIRDWHLRNARAEAPNTSGGTSAQEQEARDQVAAELAEATELLGQYKI